MVGLIAVTAGIWMVAASQHRQVASPCATEKMIRLVARLANDQALQEHPSGLGLQDRYLQTPCDNDDRVGKVGFRSSFDPVRENAVRDYYKRVLAGEGWVFRGENARNEPTRGGLDIDRPQLCFDRDEEPGIVFLVFIDGQDKGRAEIFAEFDFAAGVRLQCAGYS